jgi:hypothetical protein
MYTYDLYANIPTRIDFDDGGKFEKKNEYSFTLKKEDVEINITSFCRLN